MRSIIYHRYGEPAEVLQVTEAPDLPVPGKGEVLIRATSRPVHPGELIGVRGLYRAPGNISPVGPDNWSASNIGGFSRKVRVGCELMVLVAVSGLPQLDSMALRRSAA
jgi:hypothetical protein